MKTRQLRTSQHFELVLNHNIKTFMLQYNCVTFVIYQQEFSTLSQYFSFKINHMSFVPNCNFFA